MPLASMMNKLDSLARVQLSLIYVELRTNLVCTTDRNHDRNNVRQYWSYLSIMETLMASLPLSHSFNEFYKRFVIYVHQEETGCVGLPVRRFCAPVRRICAPVRKSASHLNPVVGQGFVVLSYFELAQVAIEYSETQQLQDTRLDNSYLP